MIHGGRAERQRLVDAGDTVLYVLFEDGYRYGAVIKAQRPDVGRLYFDLYFPFDDTRMTAKLGYDKESIDWSEYVLGDERHPRDVLAFR